MGDLTQFKDVSLTKDMEEPLQAEDLPSSSGAKHDSAQSQLSVRSKPSAAGVDNQSEQKPSSEPSNPPDLEGLLGDTVENIGTDQRYADVLTRDGDPKDVDSKHGSIASAASSNQVLLAVLLGVSRSGILLCEVVDLVRYAMMLLLGSSCNRMGACDLAHGTMW